MTSLWKSLEEEVRSIASTIWGVTFTSRNFGGRQIDAYAEVDRQPIAYEVTTQKDINKIQEDVNKLVHVRNAVFLDRSVSVNCNIVVDFEPTDMMRNICLTANISLQTNAQFRNSLIPFNKYVIARNKHPFGSAIDPETAVADKKDYVVVSLHSEQFPECNVFTLKQQLTEKRTIVLTGEFGTGKSKTVAKLFEIMCSDGWQQFTFVLAIDIKRCWGLNDRYEIIRRHLSEMNLAGDVDSIMAAYHAGFICLLLDGFDEIGLQSWAEKPERMKDIKYRSLAGIRDLVSNCRGGVLICGRDHFFDSEDELKASLGIANRKPSFIRTMDEFTYSEIEQFLGTMEIRLPDWLPRKPLSCEYFMRVASEIKWEHNEYQLPPHVFWSEYLSAICKRESQIHKSFDDEAIRKILLGVAASTRKKRLGEPITLRDLELAFTDSIGYTPIEAGAVLLQRLPGLGRLSAETNDRIFFDSFIQDGLCAQVVLDCLSSESSQVFEASWQFALGSSGQRILSAHVLNEDVSGKILSIVKSKSKSRNSTLLLDLLSALLVAASDDINLNGVVISDGYAGNLDFSQVRLYNLVIENTEIRLVSIAAPDIGTVRFENCLIESIEGISDVGAMPKNLVECTVGTFASTATTSRIKAANLTPGHKVLVTILRKTYFQKGSGREEEALLRGLGTILKSSSVKRLINKLIAEDLMYTTNGNSGKIYHPRREFAKRASKILLELNASSDKVWTYAADLD